MQMRRTVTFVALSLVAAAVIVPTPPSFDRGFVVLAADGEVRPAEEGRTTITRPTKRPPRPGPRYQEAPRPGIPGGEERLRRLKQGLPESDQSPADGSAR